MRTKTHIAALLSFALPCLAAAPKVEIADARLRAADLFVGADPRIDLGPAPAPGAERRVSQAQLARWARQAGVSADALPAELLLVRKLRQVPPGESAERIRGLLAEETGRAPADIAVELSDEATLQVPAGPLEWARTGPPPPLGRPVVLRLRWRDSSGRSGVESLTATLQVRAESASGDAGPEGSSSTQLARRPLIERGATVEIVLRVGAVHLRAPARAEGSGSPGDLIPFRNLVTQRQVSAVVLDSKTAEVPSR